jgi:hypothetical protein
MYNPAQQPLPPKLWHHFIVRIAACDPDAFYPLRSLVQGPFYNLEELSAIERFLRTVVLHDEIVMEFPPNPYDPETDHELTEEEKQAGGRAVIVAFGPVLTGYNFFTERSGPQPVPEIDLSPALLETASQFANAGEGNVYFKAHVEYLKRVLGVVEQGGSVLLCDEFGQQAVETAQQYPEELFRQLDVDWQRYAQEAEQDGLGFLVPPVLGIVLTRCARRDAIPTVIRDLRNEWATAREKVWNLLDTLRRSQTLGEASEIRKALSNASRQFSSVATEGNTRPVRVFWDILAAAVSGAAIAQLSSGKPVIGAATSTVAQVARSLPSLAREFGPTLFGRGAFDLARRVRREASKVEFDALSRLLSDHEKRKLGFD